MAAPPVMVTVVLDTNVLVAALLRGGGTGRAVLRACLKGQYQPLLGPALLAEYEDGFTRKITKKATYSTAEPAATAPVAAVGGRLRGVRPGKTIVNATFEGQNTKKRPLEVEFALPVMVEWNGARVFEGLVAPDLAGALRETLTTGDWRRK